MEARIMAAGVSTIIAQSLLNYDRNGELIEVSLYMSAAPAKTLRFLSMGR